MVPTGTVAIADAASGSPICSAVLAANPDGSATGSCSPTDDQFPSGTALTSVSATSGGDGSDLASLSAGDAIFPSPIRDRPEAPSGTVCDGCHSRSTGTRAPLCTSKTNPATWRSDGSKGHCSISAMSWRNVAS